MRAEMTVHDLTVTDILRSLHVGAENEFKPPRIMRHRERMHGDTGGLAGQDIDVTCHMTWAKWR
jgi:hypothetical protein